MEGAFYFIYVTVNDITEKKYLGQHCTLNPNDTYLGSGGELRNDIKIYGRENFKRYYIEACSDIYELSRKEGEWMRKFDVVNSPEWYNTDYKSSPNIYFEYGDIGGKISKSNTGKKHTEETKKRIGDAQRGRKQSEEVIRKRAESIRGKKQSIESIQKRVEKLKGKKRSPEQRKKMSEATKGKASWCKGLTKEIDNRLAHKEETKKKISETLKRRFEEKRINAQTEQTK